MSMVYKLSTREGVEYLAENVFLAWAKQRKIIISCTASGRRAQLQQCCDDLGLEVTVLDWSLEELGVN